MITQHRPPMRKLSPSELLALEPKPKRPYYLVVFFLVFAIPLFAVHLPFLSLPLFWDELGQFVPTALDLLRDGAIVAHSAVPNVHPPGVELYLAMVYKIFGFSIPVTRLSMLLVGSASLLVLFLLAIDLSKGTRGAPAFLPPILLVASPLFYTQSMLAQLDMPATFFSLSALLLFIRSRYALAAAASVALVLVKETGLVVPFILALFLVWRKDWRQASYFALPAVALGVWLLVLHNKTGFWLGDPGFAHYNVEYALRPVRIGMSFVRRLYYIFFAEFRWIGTLALASTVWKYKLFRTPEWLVSIAISVATLTLVSVLGGAQLERYLLPVLPIFYIAVSVALTFQRQIVAVAFTAAMLVGLVANLYWNPPYPFPYENNLAMVDFVRLQHLAAEFLEQNLPGKTVATAWPYTPALKTPEYGFVQHPVHTVETGTFSLRSIQSAWGKPFDVLVTYTRTWAPEQGVLSFGPVRWFLHRFYDWEPQITAEQCADLGLVQLVSWKSGGQQITIYLREPTKTTQAVIL